jgi:hypothetical protein
LQPVHDAGAHLHQPVAMPEQLAGPDFSRPGKGLRRPAGFEAGRVRATIYGWYFWQWYLPASDC